MPVADEDPAAVEQIRQVFRLRRAALPTESNQSLDVAVAEEGLLDGCLYSLGLPTARFDPRRQLTQSPYGVAAAVSNAPMIRPC